MELSYIKNSESANLQPPHKVTSLVEVTQQLTGELPCRVFFKNEYEQPSRSFKIRGIGHYINKKVQLARAQGFTDIEVMASSGGNAGLAAAYASRHFGVKCTVVLPKSAKQEIISTLKSYNATVVVHGNVINEADQYLCNNLIPSLPSSKHIIYCHPFNDPLIWEGHSTIIDEIVTQLDDHDKQKVKKIVCSVGGGGLYNGLVQGVEKNSSFLKPEMLEFLLIECTQAPTMTTSVKAGEVITLESDKINSIATSLACSYLSTKSLENYYNPALNSRIETIDDYEAVAALISYYKQTGTIVEPACGAALSVVYNKLNLLNKGNTLSKDDIVIIIVCGGSHTNATGLQKFQAILNENKCKL